MSGTVFVAVQGGLGNQLFIISTGIAYSRKHNKNLYCFYIETTRKNHFNLPMYVPEQIKNAKIYSEPKFSYTEIPKFDGDIVLHGYYQSSKYFERDIINSIVILKSSEYVFPTIPFDHTPVVLHIRRTDYTTSDDFHITLPLSYYENAVKEMNKRINNPYYLIFSDDIDFANKVEINGIGDNKMVVNMSDEDSFNVMSECKYFIIANSTFSWWGAMLKGYDFVIAPKIWFGKKGHQDWQDIYESDWMIL